VPRRAQADSQNLAGRAGKALAWSFSNNATAKLGTVGIGVVLARLLGPHAFGVYAVAYVALLALLNLNDLGVSLAIVRWPDDPEQIAPTVATLSIAASVLVYLGCFFGAPEYAAAMGAPAATSVVRVLCLVVVVDGIASTPVALLQRQFKQGKKMIADQVNVWLGAGTTAGLAFAGFGPMSLAVGRVAGCGAALALFAGFAPAGLRVGFDRSLVRALLKFGLPLAGSAVITFAIFDADQLVVGHVLGVTALGFFVLAANISNWPVTVFSQPIRSVAPAALARLQHDRPAMRRGFLSAAGLLGALTLPACFALSGSATPLIGLVYGSRWLPAAQALVWLAVLSGLQIILTLCYDYFVVLAASRVVFSLQLAWLVVLTPAMILGAELGCGNYAVAMAETAVGTGFVLPCYLRYLRKAGIGCRVIGRRFWLPACGASAAWLGAFGAAALLPGTEVAALAAGAAVSVAVIALLGYRLRGELSLLRREGRPEATPDSPEATADSTANAAHAPAASPAARHWSGAADAPAAQPCSTADLPPRQREFVSSRDLPLYRQTVAALRWDPAFDFVSSGNGW